MLNKIIKVISILCVIVALVLAFCTASQTDYEEETNIPIEERMSDTEFYSKVGISLILLGVGAGGMFYVTKDE